MRKTMLMLTALALAVPFSAQPVAAQECTRTYEGCLNDTHDTKGGLRLLADVECFTKYLRCVAVE